MYIKMINDVIIEEWKNKNKKREDSLVYFFFVWEEKGKKQETKMRVR
jgi:hypothetical protein